MYGGCDEPYDEGRPYPPGHPDDGGSFAMDADLTVYWPWVRPCWEDVSRSQATVPGSVDGQGWASSGW